MKKNKYKNQTKPDLISSVVDFYIISIYINMLIGIVEHSSCREIQRCVIKTSNPDGLKMDYNENSHIKLTIEPCLCCVQVTIYCCGHVFLFIILLQFDRQNENLLLRFLKFPALHWFPTKNH